MQMATTGTVWCHKHYSNHCGCWGEGTRFLVNGQEVNAVAITSATLLTPEHLCPDLLRYEQIGCADNWRGRVVRGFFWLMRAWPVR